MTARRAEVAGAGGMMERGVKRMAERRMRTAVECPPLLTGGKNGIIFYVPVLWNRNYLLQFRFQVMVPVPTFEKVTVPVPVPVPAPYLDHKKQIFQKKIEIFFDFLLSKLFYKEKVHKFQQI